MAAWPKAEMRVGDARAVASYGTFEERTEERAPEGELPFARYRRRRATLVAVVALLGVVGLYSSSAPNSGGARVEDAVDVEEPTERLSSSSSAQLASQIGNFEGQNCPGDPSPVTTCLPLDVQALSQALSRNFCDCDCNHVDECGVCGGAGLTEQCDCDGNVLDECGVCGGKGKDECGLCGGEGILEGQCDCDGNVMDECGACGGPGKDECGTCGGTGIAAGKCDCDGNTMDMCGVCGGPGIPAGQCDCDGNTLDECGVCGGTGKDECGVCGGTGIPPGACNCDGDEEDECGVCGGPGKDECGVCGGMGIKKAAGECDCAGHTFDECNVCGGEGIAPGQCNCAGDMEDVCGVCGGDGHSCAADAYTKDFSLCTTAESTAITTLYRDDTAFVNGDYAGVNAADSFMNYCAAQCDVITNCNVYITNDGGETAAASGVNTIDWCVLKDAFKPDMEDADPHWDCYYKRAVDVETSTRPVVVGAVRGTSIGRV